MKDVIWSSLNVYANGQVGVLFEYIGHFTWSPTWPHGAWWGPGGRANAVRVDWVRRFAQLAIINRPCAKEAKCPERAREREFLVFGGTNCGERPNTGQARVRQHGGALGAGRRHHMSAENACAEATHYRNITGHRHHRTAFQARRTWR